MRRPGVTLPLHFTVVIREASADVAARKVFLTAESVIRPEVTASGAYDGP
jgi:hypothetical protein